MRSHSTLVNFSNKLFRHFLKAYPRNHRDRFHEEMAQDFRDLCQEVLRERGLSGFLRLWVSVGLDLVKTAFEEQFKVRTNPTMEKMVRLGAYSAFLAGATSILLAFTHASPNWLDWVFRLKWIWFFLGSLDFFALLGLTAYWSLHGKVTGAGIWLSLLGATFMTITGIFMPINIQIWRLYSYGIDILAVGLFVQILSGLVARSPWRWIAVYLSLGAFILIFNQFTPSRHLGLLFEWDGTLFASLMGIAWIVFGLLLLQNPEQMRAS